MLALWIWTRSRSTPTVEANTAALITEGLRGDGAVLINAEGKRFIDEVGTRDVVSAAEIAQTGSYSWLVVDQAMVDASSVIQGYIKKGYTVTGETYEELGKAMGVDEAAFAETMKTWNGYVEAKNDPTLAAPALANPLDTAPYYAIKVTAGVHHTMGGLTINTNTEVLKEDGTVIPGLFAAGEVTWRCARCETVWAATLLQTSPCLAALQVRLPATTLHEYPQST